MTIRKCPLCGQFFNFIRSPYCGACQDAFDQDCRRIRSYLADHPEADAPGIAAALGIEERTILYLLREGRLEIRQQAAAACEGCGLPVQRGKYCDRCLARLTRELNSAGDRTGGRTGGGGGQARHEPERTGDPGKGGAARPFAPPAGPGARKPAKADPDEKARDKGMFSKRS